MFNRHLATPSIRPSYHWQIFPAAYPKPAGATSAVVCSRWMPVCMGCLIWTPAVTAAHSKTNIAGFSDSFGYSFTTAGTVSDFFDNHLLVFDLIYRGTATDQQVGRF